MEKEETKPMSLLKPFTKYDKIKAMSIEEMENFLCGLVADAILGMATNEPMKSPNKSWLESEATV